MTEADNPMVNLELDENQRASLGLSEQFWSSVGQQVTDEIASASQVRSVVTGLGNDLLDPNSIPDFRISRPSDEVRTFRLRSRQTLVAARLSTLFQIPPKQAGNTRDNNQEIRDQAALALVTRCAHLIGLAEDIVAVRGEGRETETYLKNLGVQHEDLPLQENRLIEKKQKAIDAQPESVLNSILKAMEDLREGDLSKGEVGYYGPYSILVAPNLYRAAFQPQNSLSNTAFKEIEPLLPSKEYFRYSPAIPDGKGVVISLGGGTVHLSNPGKATIAWAGQDASGITLEIVERFRLLVNEPNAIQPLQMVDGSEATPDSRKLEAALTENARSEVERTAKEAQELGIPESKVEQFSESLMGRFISVGQQAWKWGTSTRR